MTAPNDRPQEGAAASDRLEDDGLIELSEHETAVPAAGGTFGVTADDSGFGQHEAAVDAAAPQNLESGDRIERALPEQATPSAGAPTAGAPAGTVEAIIRDGNRDVPASGGTFGVTEDESGYQAPGGRPLVPGRVREDEGTALPPHPGYGQTPETFGEPEFGQAIATEKQSDMLAYIGLGFAFLGLILLLIPGWAWVGGGVAGIIALACGAVAISRKQQRGIAGLAIAGGAIALAIAIATLIAILVVG